METCQKKSNLSSDTVKGNDHKIKSAHSPPDNGSDSVVAAASWIQCQGRNTYHDSNFNSRSK
jgi:hypothetical protein